MSSMNIVILIGRVVAQPELRYTTGGKGVCSFRMAVDRRGGKGENKEADFINITAWDRLGEICNEYLQKGKLISIQGSLRTRTYEDKNGEKRNAFEVVANEMQMLSTGDRQGGAPGGGGGSSEGRYQAAPSRDRAPQRDNNGGGGGAPAGWGSDSGGNRFDTDDLSVDEIPF